jgi:hypothetical protein
MGNAEAEDQPLPETLRVSKRNQPRSSQELIVIFKSMLSLPKMNKLRRPLPNLSPSKQRTQTTRAIKWKFMREGTYHEKRRLLKVLLKIVLS